MGGGEKNGRAFPLSLVISAIICAQMVIASGVAVFSFT